MGCLHIWKGDVNPSGFKYTWKVNGEWADLFMKPKEVKAYYQHKKRHAPEMSVLCSISTVQDLEQRILIIESNLRSPLRKQMDKEQRQRSAIDAQVALKTYKEAIRRLTT
jgi:hypothetical protein